MYFFVEEHERYDDNYHPTSYKVFRAKNIDKIKKYIIEIVRGNTILYYYDSPYHCFELNNGEKIYRIGKINKNEIEEDLEVKEIG